MERLRARRPAPGQRVGKGAAVRALVVRLVVSTPAGWPADAAGAGKSPVKGAWFLYDLGDGRQVRVDVLGRIQGRHHVVRSFLGGQADGQVDLHLAPRSLLACADWPPAPGRTGACRLHREVAGRDHWRRIAYTVSEGGEIAVPAGRFRVHRIAVEIATERQGSSSTPAREVWWYAPALDWPVKYRFERTGTTAVLIDYGAAPVQPRGRADRRSVFGGGQGGGE